MGLYLTNGLKWNSGYQTIGIVETILVICLIISLPLWKAKMVERVNKIHVRQVC